ncbi:hypothetical protein [Pseudomonas syringae]|uniref:hypothetical protein n=1 Tax=Pseudomonas syringae TaxID=317 RepID=UPI0015C4B824|nr:hypothetical protein [Pseudomonas syringae]
MKTTLSMLFRFFTKMLQNISPQQSLLRFIPVQPRTSTRQLQACRSAATLPVPLKTNGFSELAQLSLDEWRAGVNTGSRHHNLQ